MSNPILIGICGASASGKTSLLQDIASYFGASVSIVSQDDYYKEKSEQKKDANGFENFDLPDAIDVKKFIDDLTLLKSGKEVQLKEYTFNNPSRVAAIKTILPTKVILVEGIFIFHYAAVFEQLDLAVYIHASRKLKWERRLKRDQAERGYSADYIRYTHEQHVHPAYKKYIKPYRNQADIIITNNERGFQKGMQVLTSFIERCLQK